MDNYIVCNECIHKGVCKYEDEFRKVWESIKNHSVYESIKQDGKHIASVKPIENFDYILIDVDCRYHS